MRLYAPAPLVDSGLMRHILPRFTLKHQVRVELVPLEDAGLVFGPDGVALFQGAGAVWHMDQRSPDAATQRLADWLTSDVGRNTVTSFAPEGVALFTLPQPKARAVAEVALTGDADLGLTVSRVKCTRCHAVDAQTAMAGIGSTPSFAVLRSLPDWEERFSIFYALNPHPAFTLITDVSEPFPEDRPSPIVPIELTLDEVEAVLAYVAGMAAADLGAPLAHQ